MKIIEEFQTHADIERAAKQEAYLRHQFKFLGLTSPVRRALSKEFLKEKAKEKAIDWSLVDKLWLEEKREFQYLACDYLRQMKKNLTVSDLPKIQQLATEKSWWETVDSLDELVGTILQSDSSAVQIILQWSRHDNFWVRRIAIDCQLGFKESTDKDLLSKVILNNLGSNEFFINKAIGWALRDYSKTNPEWVRAFLSQHSDELSSLSRREAGKYL
ncbi:DNA alkylation repair protein [Lactococcus garvieae]|uniref:DNA alkylation repair enzyme n=1 Tax=Lactococcus garvieae DCC43 TaxID=1231377 RepID=K2QCH4_9LACT|nr:DNA alkylation repair protein [Lactococcus garvieae]EKF51142.1 DNA alkylation repair enzyme [Lactococcus garvieae DCC43]